MSANIKCYDPATGRVLFDISKNTTRITNTITVASGASGKITIKEAGRPFAFWLVTAMINSSDSLILGNGDLNIDQNGSEISYRNRTQFSQTLMVGVIAI